MQATVGWYRALTCAVPNIFFAIMGIRFPLRKESPLRNPSSKRPSSLWSRALTVAFSGLLAFSSVPEAAFAGYANKPIVAQAPLPSKFDLRDQGLVTPVKFQNPWGSCWAFGGIAAAATSILSRLGMTYKEYPIDLSEKHLTWYGSMPMGPADTDTQVGEGINYVDAENPNPYDAGGQNILVSTLFSSGVGPMYEETFPYRGAEGLLESDYYRLNKDALIEQLKPKYVESGMPDNSETTDYIASLIDQAVALLEKSDYYSSSDDWAIPETREEGGSNRMVFAGFTLRDGNVLPQPNVRDEDDNWVSLNDEGMKAMKSELLSGNAIEVNFNADSSQPGDVENGYSMNLDTWSQYAFEDAQIDHGVCIVGWDDNYPASKFTHKVFVEKEGEEKPVEDPELTKKSTPPGNGAWIVKNSWGSVTDAVADGLVTEDGRKLPANYKEWGYKNEKGQNTGYFYLSYYDKTLRNPETYEFDVDYITEDALISDAYDYMPSTAGFWTLESKQPISTANEFVADENQKLAAVSTRTPSENMRVEFQIYELDGNTVKPDKGELIAQFSETFPYAGYHRVRVPYEVTFDKGQRFAIVTTAIEFNDKGERVYGASAAAGYDKDCAQALGLNTYSVAVVNPGESFLKIGDNWVDWATYQKGEEFKKHAYLEEDDYSGYMVVDNFAIKAFSTKVE